MTIYVNAMTIDVEDYFHVSAFEAHVRRENWPKMASRIQGNTHRVLDLLAEHGVQATFFVLGCLAQGYPSLVRRIVSDGHELASHGFDHVRVTQLSRDAFRDDVARTKAILEDIGGIAVRGYRAPSYSICRGNLWALEELKQAGYEYSSSIYPINHDLYGMREAPRHPHYPAGQLGVLEIPVTTVAFHRTRLPCGGGGFFRLYPYWFTRAALRRVNNADALTGIFYLHPWELDPCQPRIVEAGLKSRFRHYLNLRRVEPRLRRLLRDFQWDRMDTLFIEDSNHEQQRTTGPAGRRDA